MKGVTRLNNFITEQHKKDCIETLSELVSYPSVLNEGENGTPFGQAIQDVLEATLRLCQSLGFSTYLDPEGYYGYAEVGEGEESLAILCHLDVVPAGDLSKWQTKPFEAVLKDGYIYGRGTQDDKGPTAAALYAVKALIDAGLQFKRRVRFIFGTDEETLWRCMGRYTQIEEAATFGFAPDAEFPLTYAEKGLLQVKLHGEASPNFELSVGDAFNVVPGKAVYSGELSNELAKQLDEHGFDYLQEGNQITVLGVSKHAKDAPEGVNAVMRLALGLQPLVSHPTLQFLFDVVGQDATGKGIFGVVEDEPSGVLTFNVAGVDLDINTSEIRIDMRIPVLANKEGLVATLVAKAKEYGLEYEEYDYLRSLYVPLESELIQTLMEVYREKTGDTHSLPQSSGGATFARTMENCVAYGAVFPDSEVTFHMENEKMSLKDIYEAMDIYAEVVYRLAIK